MLKIYSRKTAILLLLTAILFQFNTPVHAQISTFAGRNTYLGDGGAATSAGLYGPYAIAYDVSGNMYIATSSDNRVREVNATTNVITTLAGNGIAGYAGDNGPATAAEFNFNTATAIGIAVDKNGNVYVSDYNNNRVRKIAAGTGIATTVAGITTNGGYTGDGGAAVAANISGPSGIVTDASGNVYFVENNNCLVRKITVSTGKISTIAGSYDNGGFYSGDGAAATSAGLNYPVGLAMDASGNFYIADAGNNAIRKVTLSTGLISTVAGNGTGSGGFSGDGQLATNALLNYPVGVAVDASFNIYIADQLNSRVRKVTASTGDISTVAGTAAKGYNGDGSAATSAELNSPTDVFMDNSGNLDIVDNGNYRIRQVTEPTGNIISTVAGDGTAGGFNTVGELPLPQTVPLKAQLEPQAVALSPDGDVIIADGYYYDIRDVNTGGTAYIYAGTPNPDPAFAGKGVPSNGVSVTAALFNAPFGVAADGGNNIYVADVFNNVIREINYGSKTVTGYAGTGTAGYSGDGAAATTEKLNQPYGVAVDKNGNVYIADAGNNRIRMVNGSTKYISTIAGNGTAGYTGDGTAATAAEINYPTAVAVDATGNVFFIDKSNARVRRIDATTKYITTILNNGHDLTGIATDASGNIYVSDSTAFSVLEITAGTFAVSTIAGTGSAGYSGDGGASASAQFNYPGGLSVDASGNVYVADIKNNVVRKFKPGITGNSITTVDSTLTCDGKIKLTTLSGTLPGGGTGTYTYQWKQSPDSVIFTAISGATSQNYAANTTITTKTYYRRFVTSGTLIDSGNAIGYHPRPTPVPTISLGHGAISICQGVKDTLTASAGYTAYAWSNSSTKNPFIDSVSGSYTVTVTDSFGCKGTSAAAIITVNPPPATPTVTPSPATTTNLAPGTTVTLTSSTATSYKWSTGATTISISTTSAGSYTDTVYNASGCKAYSAPVTVSYAASPTIASFAPMTAAAGATVTITGTNFTGASAVSFGGTAAASFNVVSATSITAVVGSGTSGNVSVTTPGGTATLAGFSYCTPVTPSVSVGANTPSPICAGTNVTFTATPVNGGTTPVYQWYKDNIAVGTNSNIYSTTALSNGDSVWCVLTSNASCVTKSTAKSNVTHYTVNPVLTPSVTIAANTGSSICPGTKVTFTATPANGGSAPTYQWRKDGANVGTNSPVYVDSLLKTNDSVKVWLTSNAACAPTTTIISNSLKFTASTVTPAVTITDSVGTSGGVTSICPGTKVRFIATATNGGTAPAYQWRKDGANVGTNSPVYVDSLLKTNDSVKVILTSNAACVTATSILSSPLKFTVSTVTPTVTITDSVGTSAGVTSICSGTKVRFIATATNGGATPAYQWRKDGANVGTNSPVYVDSLLKTNDSVKVILTSNAACATITSILSSPLKFTVSTVTPTVAITDSVGASAGITAICAGTKVKFIANATNGGSTPAYQWRKDGNNVGTNSPVYVDSLLKSNDSVKVILTSNAACATTTSILSSPLKFMVNTTAPATSSAISGPISVTAGQLYGFKVTNVAGVNYTWTVPAGDTIKAGQGTDSITVKWGSAAGSIAVTASNACGTSAAVTYNVSVTGGFEDPKVAAADASIKVLLYPNPASDFANLRLSGFTGGIIVTVTDMEGRVVWRQEKLANSSYTLPISNLAQGTYIVTIKDKYTIRSLKLVKAK